MCIYRDAGADDPVRVLRRMDGHTQDITCLAFSVALGLVATACAGGGVRVWDLDDAKLVCLFMCMYTLFCTCVRVCVRAMSVCVPTSLSLCFLASPHSAHNLAHARRLGHAKHTLLK
jgi:WD40 repeat protein